jgi:type IV pilus assembly protein PilV
MAAEILAPPRCAPARRPFRKASPEAGFSLIEALVSIVLISIGVIGLMGLLATATKNNTDSQDRNRAAALANEMATAMWINGTTNVTTGSLATYYAFWQANLAPVTANPSKGLNITAPPTVTTAANGVATITITWQAPHKAGVAKSDTFNTYDSKEAVNVYTTEVVLP